MTSLDSSPSTVRTDLADVRGRGLRLALAVTAPLGALAIAAGDLIAPYEDGDGAATVLEKVAGAPGPMATMSWLYLVVVICLLPGVLAAGLAALRGAPRLATAGLLVAVPAWSAAFAFPNTDGLAQALVATGVDRGDAVTLYDSMANFSTPSMGVAVAVFVIGHIVGTVLLGLALWRSRAVPAWIGIALTLSQPLHFVAFVILASRPLDIAAYLLTAFGFGAAGIAYYRQAGTARR